MSIWLTTFLLLLLFLATPNIISCDQDLELVQMARTGVLHAMDWARSYSSLQEVDHGSSQLGVALGDCVDLYEQTEPRLGNLLSDEDYSSEDAATWLSGAVASHRTCLDGLEEKGFVPYTKNQVAQNLTVVLRNALALYGPNAKKKTKNKEKHKEKEKEKEKHKDKDKEKHKEKDGILASWKSGTSKADIVVAKDGSGDYKTINEAVSALEEKYSESSERMIIHVKAGTYNERVQIKNMKNLMFVGDGIDKTIVTGDLNVQEGSSTSTSATFGVSADGFWARDMTFENTAGPGKHQAVAMMASSDLAIFYRCSFKGYQDTLYAHSQRQFYRDCQIYGTVDFIFGDAAAVFENCDIYVRSPMDNQYNVITAQGRSDSNENTGFSITNSRVLSTTELDSVRDKFRSYLGRPWKEYSRTVFMKTEIGGFIDPEGWREWRGDFALSTLYYAEYMNSGGGASTSERVRWPGFHVLTSGSEASTFSVRNFIQGHKWIPESGVPFSSDT